ncbi:efflux transporter outer membrane subunit [Edaphobacter sp. HDX4]|uniref:efflux transporter outer membrane subunit n=1 Tax=Edaphobacter sp. HDX4 TaxID=2794064 RepID=UPI002FE57E14
MIFVFAPCLLLAGCAVGPKYHPPVAQAPEAANYKESHVNFQNTDSWKVANPQDAMLRGKWWEVFDDADLNGLEEQLNINNENIREYFQNFMQARSLVAEAHSQYWPTVSVNPSWTRQKTSGSLTNTSQANTGRTSTVMSFPVDVSWTPDFWGKIRNEVREYQYAAQVSAADLELERLTEQTSLAQYYFEIRGQDALQQILDDIVAADQKAVDFAQTQYDTGVGDYLSVVQAKSALQSAQASAISVGVARAQYEHAIAVLLGKLATDFSLPVKPLLTAPPPIPVGVPAQLLERRPDIAAAERTIAKDNAVIGIGYGAFFPNISLSASGGFESSTLSNWFSGPSRFFSVGPLISQTIFNGGLYRAELHQYAAVYNADLAAYRQTVLTAFQQVEDYLATVRIYSQQIQREQEAVKSSQEYLDLAMSRYQTGIDPYLNVLTAQTTVLSNQQTLVTLQIQQMVAAASLVEALGGGWGRSQLPTPSQVSQKGPASDYKLQR